MNRRDVFKIGFGTIAAIFVPFKALAKLPILEKKPVCCFCKSRSGKKRRQNTMYVVEEKNWVIACDECNEINEEFWDEMWRDYYGIVMPPM